MKKLSKWQYGALVAIILAAGLTWWAIYHKHQLKPVVPEPTVAINTSPSDPSSQPTATPNPNVSGGQPGNGIASGSLQPASGTFVSNHHVTLDPNDSRNYEQSTCDTNAGATCEISFTKDGVTKSLGPSTAIASKDSLLGSASWPVWTPGGLGLSVGDWKITATVTLNGQSKSATDTIDLEVSQ